MSNQSPLNFYSSSNKAKSKKNSPSRTTVSKTKSKEKANQQIEEAKAIVSRIEWMNKDLAEKIDAVCRETGKSPEELESFIEKNAGMSASDKLLLKKIKSDFAEKIKETSSEEKPSEHTTKTSRKEGRPTGDLRTKSLGAKRKWMPVK